MANNFAKNQISPTQHGVAIVKKYKNLVKRKNITSSYCEFILEITPSAISRTYVVKIIIMKDKKPYVYVIEPCLKDENTGKIPPHMYSLEEGKVCLNLPSELLLSNYFDIIIPWISEWLVFYEIWKITGKWLGHGHGFSKKEE